MEWGNIGALFSGGRRLAELESTRAQWMEAQRLWRASRLATSDIGELAREITTRLIRDRNPLPASPIITSVDWAIEKLLAAEEVGDVVLDWSLIDGDVEVASNVRSYLSRRRRWAADFDHLFGVFQTQVVEGFDSLFEALPQTCFGDWDMERGDPLGVPLVELLERPAEAIEQLVVLPYDDGAMELGLFHRLRAQLITNVVVASGFSPGTDPATVSGKLVMPTRQKGKTPAELADLYLRHTPFLDLMDLPVPFEVPAEMRFEHCHIIGGTGHGKTQLLQRMIHDDLVSAQKDGRSVVVIDSQGDLINKLLRLELFSPEVEGSLADRLVLVDPADIEFPAALNLFDAHLDRTKAYSPVDREKVLNGVVELYETFFGAMLGAELTQKQGVIFRYLARLMVEIPGATIHTLMQIMEDGVAYKPHMARLQGSAKHFFATEFFHPSFAATKKQILRRLWGVLSTPAFERMFVQKENKLDLYAAMNEGKIILVSTAKDLLKADGSALLGRFFIAMIAQAALERSVIPAKDRTPTFVYVDEAQEYFDDNVEAILNQARKYRVGLTLAHQTLDQLSLRLRSALYANTSLKFAGGVSAKDARSIADELHTTSDFVESMRRCPDRTEFAAWLKGMTPSAVRLTTPLGYLERQPTSTAEALDELLARNRERYCGKAIGSDASGALQDEAEASATPPFPQTPREDLALCPAAHSARPVREMGKGGRRHRYLQALIKELGEQQGFRAIIEAPVPGGQVDVLLERDGLRVAFEVSVTTTADHEHANIRKCLSAGVEKIALVTHRHGSRAVQFREALSGALEETALAKVTVLVPEELPDYVLNLALTLDGNETRVSGYKVTRSFSSIGAAEARERRNAVAKIISRKRG